MTPHPMSEEHKARCRENLAKARQRYAQVRFRRPPKRTPEYNLYQKLWRELGTEKAREVLCAPK
jgi:hypothetical protein